MTHTIKTLLFLSLILLTYTRIQAEGSKELMINTGNSGYLQIFAGNDAARAFMTYNNDSHYRLHINISSPGEIIYMGFNQPDGDVYFRIRDPFGNIVMGPTLIPSSGDGFINSFSEASAGPLQVVGAGGYSALTFNPTSGPGDYYIEFNPQDPVAVTAAHRVFTYFDISVSNSTSTALKTGRVWAYQWDLSDNGTTLPFNTKFFIYTIDGMTTSAALDNATGTSFIVAANSSGSASINASPQGNKSATGNQILPEYKIFLNSPDASASPSGAIGTPTAIPSLNRCKTNEYYLLVNVSEAGILDIIIDLDTPSGYTSGSRDRFIRSQVTTGNNYITWDGKDGQGNTIAETNLDVQADYYNGLAYLCLYNLSDNNSIVVQQIAPAGPVPRQYWDDSDLGGSSGTNCASSCHNWSSGVGNNNTVVSRYYSNIITANFSIPIPSVVLSNAGADQILCNATSVSLSATPAGGTWTSVPSATFANANSANTTATISIGTEYKFVWTQNNFCANRDTVVVQSFSITPANGGSDISLCQQTQTTLDAVLPVSMAGEWTVLQGNATVTDPTDPASTIQLNYSTAADTIVYLSWKTSDGTCFTKDSIVIVNDRIPSANAGADINNATNQVNLSGTAQGNYNSIIWSTSGTGSFNSTSVLNPVYTLSAADKLSGSVSLTLMLGSDFCGNASDVMIVTPKIGYTLSGNVSAGGIDLDSGKVFLFMNVNSKDTIVQEVNIFPENNGDYSFTLLEAGNYKVYVVPNQYSDFLQTHLPTYNGNVTVWEDASYITITSLDISGEDISLVEFTPANNSWNTGTDLLRGTIYLDASSSFFKTTSTEEEVPFAVVYIRNNSGALLGYTNSDIAGEYSFSNLSAGTYRITIEYAGYFSEAEYTVVIDGNAGTISTLDLYPSVQSVSGAVYKEIMLYPNPAQENIYFQLLNSTSEEIRVRIYNSNGIQIEDKYMSPASNYIDISNCLPGLYQFQLFDGDMIYTQTFIKK